MSWDNVSHRGHGDGHESLHYRYEHSQFEAHEIPEPSIRVVLQDEEEEYCHLLPEPELNSVTCISLSPSRELSVPYCDNAGMGIRFRKPI